MAGAALVCAWIGLPGSAFAPAATGIVLAWGWHLVHALRRGKSALRALEMNSAGGVRCQDGLGQWQDLRLLPGSSVSRWLIVMILGEVGKRGRSLVLLPDSAAAEELRRLRAWLRWRPSKP
jgi:hypothetical protein